MSKKNTKKNENDIVLAAKQKSKFFEEYYANLQTIQDKLTIEEINIMAKALEVATIQAKEREAEKHRKEIAAKERAIKEAELKKKEREEKRRAAKLAREEAIKHREHVKSVTCMDLPLDFSNAFEGNNEICEHVESVADGLIASLDNLGAVDIEYISEVTGIDMKDIIKELDGAIYQNPLTWNECWYKGFETSDEYLSGNILYKLEIANDANEEYLGYFEKNVEALKALVAPKIEIKDIYCTLGSPWIPADVIDDFILHLVGLNPLDSAAKVWEEQQYKVLHDEFTGIWEVPEKGRFNKSEHSGKYEQIVFSAFGTKRMPMLFLLENTLNQKTVQITDGVDTGTFNAAGKPVIHRFVNNDETIKAVEKQEKLVEEFQNWVWSDEKRAQRLQNAYCNKFGNIKKRVFKGEFLKFPNMSKDISLYDYQKDAVARILFTPNTLLSHDVGAGKTFVMIAAGMELRRLHKSKKNLYVVPNNILGQWKNTFLKMYPDAKLLVVDEKNFKPSKRAATIEQIKTEDFDAIIMAYSSFDMLSLSKNYYKKLYESQLEMLNKAHAKFNKKGKIEVKEKRIRKALEKLEEEAPKNICTIPFDELGINTLFLDEAHYYKNVPIATEIHRVHGINKAGSDKCKAMMDKVHCIQRQNNGGRVVFATGTPITNSLTDLFVIQKYLQEGELEFAGIHNFDNWVGMFAEKTTEYEIDVDTNSYHLKTRFARFKNVPELTAILSSIADFHHEDNNENLPEFEGYTDSVSAGSDIFKDFLKDISNRADDIRNKRVQPDQDNMLKITTDGRKAALDMRLVDLIFGRESESKVMRCAENIADVYYDTRDTNSVQLVFCDISTPKEGFNLYDELKSLLIAMGIPGNKIAFIHEAENERQKEELFRELRKGEKSVLIGSTFKTGHGVNIQERLVAMHHLDVPWRPADMVQREGRILRRGNNSKSVKIFRYITKGSFDAYSWQLLESKQRFISQILSGDCTQRECADVDETVLNYAEVKALAVGNPKIKRRVEVANELSKYRILERDVIARKSKLREELDGIPANIEKQKRIISLCEKDIKETDVLIAEETKQREKEEALQAVRRAAIDAKNVVREKARQAESEWKSANKAAKEMEKAAKKEESLLAEAESLRKIADELFAVYEPLKAELKAARDEVKEKREFVAENLDDGDNEEYRKTRSLIFNTVKNSVNKPEETCVMEYRGFKIIVPAYMKPRKPKVRNAEGLLVESDKEEYYIYLVKNGKHLVNLGEEFGVIRRIDNMINDLRGQKEKYEKRLNDLTVRIDVINNELAREEGFGDNIKALQAELDLLDEELGLKVVS